jgi:hypothetical protein
MRRLCTRPLAGLTLRTGTYQLRDSILISTPPPHPSEPPAQTNNPLVTHISPPTAGTKLSLAIIAPKHASHAKLIRPETPVSVNSTASSKDGSQHAPTSSHGSKPESLFKNPPAFGEGEGSQIPLFGSDNPALTIVNGKKTKDATKERKPKNNLIKTNSSFVSRVIPHDSLAKRLGEHKAEELFVFANVNRAIQWLDLSAATNKVRICRDGNRLQD